MNTFHFTQNTVEFDKLVRRKKRLIPLIIVAGFFLFAFIFSFDIFQLRLPFNATIFACVVYVIILGPITFLLFRNMNQQRGSSITISEHSILQKSPTMQREIAFANVRSLQFLRSKEVLTINLYETTRHFINIGLYAEIDEIAELLKQRVSASAEIRQQPPRSFVLTNTFMVPQLIGLIAAGLIGFWSSQSFLDIFPTLTVIAFIPFLFSGLISKAYAPRMKRGKIALRSAEISFGLLCTGLVVALISYSNNPLFSLSHPCNPLNRRATGCQRFVTDAEHYFTFANNSNDIIFADRDQLLRQSVGLFGRVTSKPVATIPNRSWFDSELLSPDQSLYVADDIRDFFVYDLNAQQEVWTVGTFDNDVLSFSADSTLLAIRTINRDSGDLEFSVELWNPRENQLVATYLDAITAQFSSTTTQLAYETHDQQLHIVDYNSGETILQQSLSDELSHILGMTFSPSGDRLAIASDSATVVLSIPDGTTLQTFTYDASERAWQQVSLAFSPDGQRLFKSHYRAIGNEKPSRNSRFSTGNTIWQATLLRWDLTTGQLDYETVIEEDDLAIIDHIAVSADGTTVGVGTWHGLHLLDATR